VKDGKAKQIPVWHVEFAVRQKAKARKGVKNPLCALGLAPWGECLLLP